MSNDDHAVNTEQRGTAILSVVGATTYRAERWIHEGHPGKCVGAASDGGAKFTHRKLSRGFEGLQDQVACEAIANREVNAAVEDPARLDIADKVER